MEDVYNRIAPEFDKTRHAHWKCVRDFLDMLPASSLVADIGCGNGKNMTYRRDLHFIANDISSNLIDIAKTKEITSADFMLANGLSLPFRDNMFDAAISIAVLHHLPSLKQRQLFVDEILRCVKPNGLVLITVWASEQPKKANWSNLGGGDFFIPWRHDVIRYYHLFTSDEINDLFKDHHVYEHRLECFNHCLFLRKKDESRYKHDIKLQSIYQ